ncbi:hypothetical protein [Methylophilus sp.]|uniref:hypothetical protein n=1 Tax=Methylophilus sp. TaxID=29541 RepID=UPI004035886B
MITRKGMSLHYLLFAAVAAPTMVLMSGSIAGGVIALLLSLLLVNIFTAKYPKLINLKRKYIEFQLVGLVAGLAIFNNAAYKDAVLVMWVLIMFIFFFKSILQTMQILSD